ncbi:hypothetical protein [Silvibacterium dinghuense]|uniref:Uncharacterized protein n=1 Tax=Silvibacterium dinghuense TaxID=1560006 RepID=A0A4Q1SCZ2_9BACT|nr:hypothetical protein [Silvibacterium dinghuense]RXS94937.1 hypothetical protein ESZ00_09875 [Silvibacterium dinghuense]GGH09192.1 hypothetical protein GCM10011586_27060 [Silvibacterium dinghuense]
MLLVAVWPYALRIPGFISFRRLVISLAEIPLYAVEELPDVMPLADRAWCEKESPLVALPIVAAEPKPELKGLVPRLCSFIEEESRLRREAPKDIAAAGLVELAEIVELLKAELDDDAKPTVEG